MKKLFAILCAVMLIGAFTASSAMADPYADAGSSTAYEVGSDYKVTGLCVGTGEANSKVFAPKTGDFSFANSNVGAAGAYSAQKVKSDAWGAGFGIVETSAHGQAIQGSGAVVDLDNGNWAYGEQMSGASYDASSKGCLFDLSKGNASTIGGTLVGAANFNAGNTTVGMSGAVVGSAGKAHAGCHEYDTDAWGNGSVEQASYASRGDGQAWTHGTASYNYHNDGYHNASGAGMAATAGKSTVTTRPNGVIKAHSVSGSFSSTGGPVTTEGGTYISNLPQ
jgi:hypothetical protein